MDSALLFIHKFGRNSSKGEKTLAKCVKNHGKQSKCMEWASMKRILRSSGKGIFNKMITLVIRLLQIAGIVLKKSMFEDLIQKFLQHSSVSRNNGSSSNVKYKFPEKLSVPRLKVRENLAVLQSKMNIVFFSDDNETEIGVSLLVLFDFDNNQCLQFPVRG